MRYALGVPGGPVRCYMTGDDIPGQLLPGEVMIPSTVTGGAMISADGTQVIPDNPADADA